MKVIIRPLQESDAETSYKWRNDPEVWKYTESRPDKYITVSIEKEWIRKVLQRKDQKRFAICVNDDMQYVGNVQLTSISDSSAEFHIFIGEKEFWRKGIGSLAIELILNYARVELNLKEIYLYVKNNNTAAIKMYKKCGFVQEELNFDSTKMIRKIKY